MLLPNKDGIKCDICGEIKKNKFIYYSYDIHKIIVNLEKIESKEEKLTDVNESIIGFDVCENCHKININKMLENNNVDV